MKMRSRVSLCVVVAVSGLVASCGTEDSRERNFVDSRFCNQGGPCRVGDVSPTGGIVVLGADDPDADMWEVAPVNGYGTHGDATSAAATFEFGGEKNWELPSLTVVGHIRDAIAEFACAENTDCGTAFGSEPYWMAAGQSGQPQVVSFLDGSTTTPLGGARNYYRPVRKFRMFLPELEVAPVEDKGNPDFYTTSSATTSTTSTTIPVVRTCAEGGSCVLGDVGPGGGVVFYVAESNFASVGSDCNTACRYMEITKTDTLTASPWIASANGCYGEGSDVGRANCTRNNSIYPNSANPPVARAAAVAIGMGMANTNQIRSRMDAAGVGPDGYAAGVAWGYASNGTTDWFLPSKEELNEVFKQRSRIPGITVNTSTSASTYQSSTETTPFFSWAQTMSTGFASNVNKTARYRVRAVRAFGPQNFGADSGSTTTTELPVILSPAPTGLPDPQA